jgi:3-oxoacyl-[acyl-carrier-protein] synthase-3
VTEFLLPVRIIGCGYDAPDRVVTNDDMARLVDTSDAWIREMTGIHERRFAADDEALSDLGLRAARQAIAHAGIDPAEIDLIVVATSTPDMCMPASAALIQARLGASRAACFDLEAACTGFVYGVTVAQQFLQTGMYRTALVVGGDLLSRYLNFKDRRTAVLFGDGAGAVVLQSGGEKGLLATHLGADGNGGDFIQLPVGSRVPPSVENVEAGRHNVVMNGREVYRFAVDIVPRAIENVLQQASLPLERVDHIILHQANRRIMEAAAKRLGIPEERMVVNIDRFSNTSAGTIPIALAEAVEQGRIRKGDLVCLVGFGSGLTWGSMLLEWTSDTPMPPRDRLVNPPATAGGEG